MRFFIKFFITSLSLGLIVLLLGYVYYSYDLPDITEYEESSEKKIIQINFSNGKAITTYGNSYRGEVKFYQLPANLINAVTSIEDQKFFTHHGFDISAIVRAFYINQKAGKIKQGASTITQQLAKMLFLSPKRTMKRKIQELILAFKLENRYSKEQLLAMYLNNAYFGAGNYGIVAAAKYYFGKDVSRLNLKESALLAGLLKAPSKLSPANDKNLAEERMQTVLQTMVKSGFVATKRFKELDSPVVYKTNRLQRLYFTDYVKKNFSGYLNKQDLKSKKIEILTTLDIKTQLVLEEEINKFVDKNNKAFEKTEIAAVILDKSGAILAMSGGKNYQSSQYNRAIDAQRQAGSIFKIFTYITAFQRGFDINDTVLDKRVEFSDWIPGNYSDKYLGIVTLKEAFAKSLNSVAIQLAQKSGVKNIIKNARKLGIISNINKDLTIALGSNSVNLLEITNAYAAISNELTPVIAHSIKKIEDKFGNILYQRDSSGLYSNFKQETYSKTLEVLKESVKSGTAKNADVANKNIYGKTGTSQEYKDAWFIGFDDKYIIGIWMGNDDNSPTNKISGGSYPAMIFANIISRL